MIGFFVPINIMMNLIKYLKLAKNKLVIKFIIVLPALILANILMFPSQSLADTDNVNISSSVLSYQLVSQSQGLSLIQILNPEVISYDGSSAEVGHLPKNKGLDAIYSVNAVLTAYNSEIGQTDDSPCITANGFDLCKNGLEDTVAINGVKMGTKVRFPDLFGNRVFVVRDRMNSRYGSSRVDVWMLSKADAKNFGVKIARMEVVE
jgi:3D (Asp-Asp-Asp) domain-containing protein